MKKRILVVEDDAPIAHLLKVILEKADFEISTASGERGCREILSGLKTPDLILMDILLGQRNGMELYEEMREEGLDPAISVLFLSASVKTVGTITGPSGKRYQIIGKPFETKELVSLLRSMLSAGMPSRIE